MGEVIDFKPKEVVFILNFVSPHPLPMNKTGGENIHLTINRKDFTTGIGQAWVPAVNKRTAKQKLSNMIEVLEWLD
jgi:hypothetical protein